MPLLIDVWESGLLPEQILVLLEALTGQPWQAHEATGHIEYPRPGIPMRLHHHRWTLLAADGSQGMLRLEEEEDHLGRARPALTVSAVEAGLEDGRRVFTEGRYPLVLLADGFSEAALEAAALAAGVQLRQRAGAG